jgi:outer membrane receptor protein involved in Fe transport
MKKIVTLILALFFSISIFAQVSIKDAMVLIGKQYGVNFVYDSKLPVNAPYNGKKLKKQDLDGTLKALFDGSGINWERKKKYVILTASKPVAIDMDNPVCCEEKIHFDTIAAATITGMINRDVNSTQTGLIRIDGAAFRRAFATGSAPDVIKTLQTLSGISSGVEMLSDLYVHGGDGSDNLFLLDGVPIYQTGHLGGIFSSFNTDVIENLDFYKSGFPARCGGRTSSVVDISTAEGSFTDYKGLFSIGLLETRGKFEGPLVKDRTSINVALRRSWADAILYPIFAIQNAKSNEDATKKMNLYSFGDFNLKITHKLNEKNRLYANIYAGKDRLKSSEYEAYSGEKRFWMADDEWNMRWGNILTSLNWQNEISSKLNSRIIVYWSGSRSKLDYNSFFDSQEPTYKEYPASWTNSGKLLTNRNKMDDLGITADFSWIANKSHHLRFGVDYIWHLYRPEYSYNEYNKREDTFLNNYTEMDTLLTSGREAGLYFEDEIEITKWFRANAGFRYTMYNSAGKIWNSLEPRIALMIRFTPQARAKLSYTEMSQFSHRLSPSYLELPTNCWVPSNQYVGPMRSRQAAAGIYFKFPHHTYLNIEGWYKSKNNLLEYGHANSFFTKLNDWENHYYVGKGRSYGMEVDLGYETGALSLNAFYTLSWNERLFEGIWKDWYRDRNDNRHKLTLQANWRINDKWELYGAWHFHSGSRMTLPTHYIQGVYTNINALLDEFAGKEHYFFDGHFIYEEPNNVKLPDYHRLDIGVNIYKKTLRGHESVWNISIYNLYCRLNPFFGALRREDIDRTNPTIDPGYVLFKGVGVGVLPLIPSFSYTIKF